VTKDYLLIGYDPIIDTLTPIVHEPTIRAQLLGAVPTNKKQGSEVLLYMVAIRQHFVASVLVC